MSSRPDHARSNLYRSLLEIINYPTQNFGCFRSPLQQDNLWWNYHEATFSECEGKQFEPPHDKTNKMTVRPAKTQISLGIRPVWSESSLRMKKAWALSYPLNAHQRLWSDCAEAQAKLSLRWAHSHFVGFVMRRLIWRRHTDNHHIKQNTHTRFSTELKHVTRHSRSV